MRDVKGRWKDRLFTNLSQAEDLCDLDNLVAAARDLGSTARVPTLWIYTQNDTFFGPALSKSMFEAFTTAGGIGEYHLLPAFKEDGHFFVDYPEAVQVWAPIVLKFLAVHREANR